MTSRHSPLATVVVAWTLSAAGPAAAADSFVVVPPGTGDGVDPTHVAEVLRDWVQHHDEHLVDVPQDKAEATTRRCLTIAQSDPPACAAEYRTLSEADWALAAWVDSHSASVAIILDTDTAYRGHATGGDWRRTLGQALAEARRWRIRGPGPWVHVRGFPVGALIRVAGKVAGHIGGPPIEVPVGSHDIEVSAPGYEPVYRSGHLSNKSDHTVLQVSLAPSDPEQAPRQTPPEVATSPTPTRRKSALLTASGAGLVAVGLPLASLSALAVSRSGKCWSSGCDEGGIPEGDQGRNVALWVVGAVSVAAGGTLLAFGIKRLGVEASRERAALTLGGEF